MCLNSREVQLYVDMPAAPALNKWLMLFVAVVVTLRVSTGPTANVSFFVLAIFALFGRAQAIHALALCWLFGMLSSGVAAETTLAAVGRYAVFAAAAVSVLIHGGWLMYSVRVSRVTIATVMLGIFLACHSVLFSPIVDVSVLKVLSWTIVTITLFAAWGGLNEEARAQVELQIFAGLVAVLVCSLPLLAVPALGYMMNGTGFQGVLNQPQAFGPTMALLGAWAGARMLDKQRPPWPIVLMVVACLVLVVLSEARTAGLAMVLGLSTAVLVVPWVAHQPMRLMLPGLMSKRFYLVAVAAVIGVALSGAMLTDRIGDYLNKGSRVESTGLVDAYNLSRGNLIDLMLENIELHPLTGIGFGIASYPEAMIVDRDPYLGLPTGASVEKGVFPIAVVEELGFFAAVAVVAWIWMVVRRAGRGGVAALALVMTTLIINLGENIFFSPGGLGLLPLILMTWAGTAKPAQSSTR